jgi:hypothetical protein
VLDGQIIGQEFAADGSLKMRDSYGSPETYIGISIVGWSPFK